MNNAELVSAAFATLDRSFNPIASKGQSTNIASVSRALPLETAYFYLHWSYPEITCWQRLFCWSKQDHQSLMALWDWWTVQLSLEEMVLLVWAKESIDFLQAHVNEVVNFLSQCDCESKSYSTGTYRSALQRCALSTMLFAAVGLHLLVDMLLNEIYHLRVSLPHYLSTWDVVKVTTYLRTLSLQNNFM